MSHGSLWGIDPTFCGCQKAEFKNAWFFAPLALDYLMWEYFPGTEKSHYVFEAGWTPGFGDKLNQKINESDEQADRVVWELTCQQVFYSKDKDFVAAQLRRFYELHKSKMQDTQEAFCLRINQLAAAIEALDADAFPFFVHKNSSVDDEVERWFKRDGSELGDDVVSTSLRDYGRSVTEFIVIEDGKITGFISNLDFDYGFPVPESGMSDRDTVTCIKKRYPKGTGIELDHMDDPYTVMPKGLRGIVELVDDIGQIHCNWENGSSLAVLPGVDSFHRIEDLKPALGDGSGEMDGR